MDAKTEIFIEYKALLFSVAYNMLGEVEAAEDIVQDTFLKWMKMEKQDVRHIKAYLVKTVTNKCINYLDSARLRREEYVGLWLPEPLLNYDLNKSFAKVESYHALSIGILVLLEKLTPQERAIFLLKEVFAYDYFELAEMFGKTEENCRQIMKRARENLGKDSKRFEVDVKLHEKMLNKFLSAVSEGSLEHFIDLLKEDIVLYADGGGNVIQVNGQRLTAFPNPIHGRDHVGRSVIASMAKLKFLPDLSQEVIIVNGLPSILSFTGDKPIAIVSIEAAGEKIKHLYIQTNPAKLRRFSKTF
jgi:RNA polymerase sigma-70 factor (ECF subfamily)